MKERISDNEAYLKMDEEVNGEAIIRGLNIKQYKKLLNGYR